MANSMENYVRALSRLETRISNMERNNQSQAFTSIENTRLEFRDEDGNVTGTLGIQDDGSTGFVPVLPPEEVKEPRVLAIPTAPLLDESVSAVSVTWDGLTILNEELPMDFYCIEIHASETEDFEASDLTLVSALYEEQGSSSVVGPIISGTWYFRLRLRARNGEVSEASASNSIEVTLDLPELNDVLENASGGNNHYSPTPPVPGENGFGPNDIWFDSSIDPDTGLISYMPHHWTETDGWVSLEDQRIQAIKDAQEDFHVVLDETQQKASDAQAQADLANDKAQALLEAGNSIIPNGDFENPSLNIWPNTSYQSGISVENVEHARSGSHVLRMDTTTANRYPLTDWRESAANRIYYAEVWVYHNDTDATQRGRVTFYAQSLLEDGSTAGYYGADLDGTNIYVYQDEIPVGEWTKVSAYVITPANTLKVRVAPHSLRNETPFDFDDFKVIDVTEAIAALREAKSAQENADAAHTAAGDAQDAADAAMEAATHNAKNLFSTANPSGTAPKGTIWFKTDSSGQVIGQWQQTGGSDTADGSTWTKREISNEVIANLDAGKIVSGYIDVARIKAGSLNADIVLVPGSAGSTVIKDGAITTAKIATGAITAESGVIGSLDLGKATVGELDGVRIKSGTVNTDQLNSTAINGMEIVAAKIYTSKTGARIQLLTTGLSAYSSSNVRTFNIASSTGDVEMIGKLYTGTSGGYRTVLNQESWDDFSEFPIYGGGSVKSPMVGSGLRLGKDTSVTTSAEVFYAEETYYTGTVSKYLRLNGPTVSSRRSELAIGTSGLIGGYRNTSNALFLSSISANKDGATLRHETDSNGYFSVVDVYQSSSSNPKVMIGAKASTSFGDMNTITVDGSEISLTTSGADLTITNNRVTSFAIPNATGSVSSNAASVYVRPSSGVLFISSSSRRYKTDIKDADDMSSILDVQLRKWHDKAEVESMPELEEFREKVGEGPVPRSLADAVEEPEWSFGAIAEEVDELGLSELVRYDAFNRPDGLHYEKFGVALIPVVRGLNNRIAELENLLANS